MKKELTLLALASLLLAACGGKEDPVVVPETPKAPSAPKNVKVNKTEETRLFFQWDPVENAATFDWELQHDGVKVDGGMVKTRNVEVKNLTKATDYRFGVRAVNDGGASSMTWIDARTGGTVEPPTPPSDQYYADFSIPAAEEDGVPRAFPGAEGGGMYTTGGRGGKVIHVRNTNDSGTGSLRAALAESGKRTIVFDVAGIIELQSPIYVTKGDLTIAGQTAPGGGICVKNYTINLNADNIIVRNLHFRLGDEGPNAGDGEDCIWSRYHKNIILDHCSMSWSIDECASFYANEFFTMQWCILTESMNDSAHSKGAHGYGGIWGGKDASFHHNLLANHHSRNPRIDHPEIYPNIGTNPNPVFDLSKRGNVDLRNLVVYNWGDNSSYGGEDGHFNFVNCYYKPGPDSRDRHYFVDAYKDYTREVRDENGKKTGEKVTIHYAYPALYLSGNKNAKYSDISNNNATGIYWHNGGNATLASNPHKVLGSDGRNSYTTTHSAEQALELVLTYGGDNLHRDSVDERAVNGVRNNTGKIINTPADVGGWPAYTASEEQMSRVKDSDSDGMPDWFEDQFGLNKSDKNDATQITLDKNNRYTNLEMYLHFLVKDIVAAQNAGGEYKKL